jgi:hypothetical protein
MLIFDICYSKCSSGLRSSEYLGSNFLGLGFYNQGESWEGREQISLLYEFKIFFQTYIGFSNNFIRCDGQGLVIKGPGVQVLFVPKLVLQKKNKHLRECQLVISFLFYSLKHWNVMVSKINSLFAQKICNFLWWYSHACWILNNS